MKSAGWRRTRLENNLTVLFVEMVNKAGDCFSQTFTLSGPGKGNISDLNEAGGLRGKLDFEKVKGLTPASINVEAIRKQYEEAKAMIPENYTFKSIGDYLIQETVPSGNEFLDRNKNVRRSESRVQYEHNRKRQGDRRKRRQEIGPVLRSHLSMCCPTDRFRWKSKATCGDTLRKTGVSASVFLYS